MQGETGDRGSPVLVTAQGPSCSAGPALLACGSFWEAVCADAALPGATCGPDCRPFRPPSAHLPHTTAQSEEGFFQEKQEKAPLPAEYVANQKAVDAALLGKLRCAPAARPCRPPSQPPFPSTHTHFPFDKGAAVPDEPGLVALHKPPPGGALSGPACLHVQGIPGSPLAHPVCPPALPPFCAATSSRATCPPASRCALATGRT